MGNSQMVQPSQFLVQWLAFTSLSDLTNQRTNPIRCKLFFPNRLSLFKPPSSLCAFLSTKTVSVLYPHSYECNRPTLNLLHT